MKKKLITTTSIAAAIFFASLILCSSVFLLMNHVQDLLNTDVQINLTEIVSQNKDVIASRLKLETNNIKTISHAITEKMEQEKRNDPELLKDLLHDFTSESENNYVAIANNKGEAFFRNGEIINIYARSYFKLAINGKQNVSEKIISRLNGEEIYVICTPLVYQDKIIGTLQKGYTSEQMYELCSVSLFSDKGNMYIINSDGYIVINSQKSTSLYENANYYRALYLEKNIEASKQLENDIKKGSSGFFESTNNGQKTFSAYTPITDIHDWYLITSVPINAVSANGGIVVNMFYFILIIVVVIITLIALVFLWYKSKQQKELTKIAFIDPVTQGYTFNKFIIDVEDALSDHPNRDFYILKFDIDNFKYINNYFGFDFGDSILYKIQEYMSEKLIGHEILARIYSDQFVAFLEEVNDTRIQQIIDDIKKIDPQTSIYISAGIYKITDYNETVSLMVDKARTAAQTVKNVLDIKFAHYNSHFSETSAHDEQLKRAVTSAIKNADFIPYFQPKIHIQTHELIGSEALARWVVDGKIIPPDEFIPMCERTGIIVDIDMIILEKVLQFLRMNLDRNIKCSPISVNFSRLHLLNPKFIECIMAKLKQYDIPPQLIEIELTESAFFNNIDIISDFASKLHEFGLTLAMDDFGSGYSSLKMLKDIHIDVLKIDKDFLSTRDNQERREIIFDSIVEMAHRLNIKVVVEGVETLDNVNLMQSCRCFVAQGYYFARPMKEEDFESIYKEGKL